MKITSKLVALLLGAAVSTAAWAQEDVTATKTAQSSLFSDSSIYIQNYYLFQAAGSTSNSFQFRPHFKTPIFNNFAVLDVWAKVARDGRSSVANFTPYVWLSKTLADNDNFYVEPYLEFKNPGKGKDSSVTAYFYGVAQLPIETTDGKVTPFILNESGLTAHTSKQSIATNWLEDASLSNSRSLTGEKIEELGLADSVVGNPQKYPIATYTRVGFSFEPTDVKDLKITAATNFIVGTSDDYFFDSKAEGDDQNNIVNVKTKWTTTTQPMLRLEYKINKSLHLRNDTTYDFDDIFGATSAGQETAGNISNTTRLTYTMF